MNEIRGLAYVNLKDSEEIVVLGQAEGDTYYLVGKFCQHCYLQ